jgi:4-azaleucine resistance transporter AzlC
LKKSTGEALISIVGFPLRVNASYVRPLFFCHPRVSPCQGGEIRYNTGNLQVDPFIVEVLFLIETAARANPPNRTVWLTALPIAVGYLPVAVAFGLLAQEAGLSLLNIALMSMLVYAGSSQLIAVGLFAAGVSPASIIVTTFVVNLRHLLMSAALSPYLQKWRRSELFAFAFELTDETFAVHSNRFQRGDNHPREALTINLIAQVSWVAGSLLGAFAGGLVTDVRPLGLDYALIAMFIALLVLQVKDRPLLVIAVAAGLLSTGLLLAGLSQWNVILATLIAATAGMAWEVWSWTKTSSS